MEQQSEGKKEQWQPEQWEIDNYNRIQRELEEDKQELKAAFEKFSHKYGANIVSFHISRRHDAGWALSEIIMDGRLFSFKSEDGREPYPMG